MKHTLQKNDVLSFILVAKRNHSKTLSQLLKSFALKDQLLFEELNPEFLSGFERFLENRNYKPSSVFLYLSSLRSFCNKALKQGITSYYPFSGYRISQPDNPKPYYTKYQLQKLSNVEHFIKPLVQHAFYFVLYTGITASELRNLTIVQTKQMKLNTYARNLSEKIISGRIKEDELLFKGLPEKGRLSSALRLWGAFACLEQKPTLLCARNTFVMNELCKGKSIQQIAKDLGLKHCKGFSVHKQVFNALSNKVTE